jgi:hypothetical protein
VVGDLGRQSLLVDLLALDAVREALQVRRPVPQRPDQRAHPVAVLGCGVAVRAGQGDRAVVLDQVPFRPADGTQLREVDLARVGQPHGYHGDVEFLGRTGHDHSLLRGSPAVAS